MPGDKKRTNPVLFMILILLCVFFGIILTGSSAKRSSGVTGTEPDMFVAADKEDAISHADDSLVDGDSQDTENVSEPTVTPEPIEKPVEEEEPQKEEPQKEEASPEASKGVWTSSGSNWMFLVDGAPYTGWLIDTDEHHYYFDKDGIMQTGWLEDDGNTYYLDMDGIMQTGEVIIDKETYVFLNDGRLKDGKTETSGKDAEAKQTEESVSEKKLEESKKSETKDKGTAETEEKDDKAAEESEEKTAAAQEEAQSDDKKTNQSQNKKTVALTFDDGPSSFTDRLLDCLEANQAKATFFLVGEEASYFPDQVKRIDSLGCEIGNHSYSHTDFTTLDSDGIASEISRTDQLLQELTGHVSTVLRPPYGSINDAVVSQVTVPMILWSIDTEDWETLDAQKTADAVLSQVEDGSIVLMHDIYSQTVDAAEIIIPKLIEQGYELVTVHELAEAHGIELQAGSTYSVFNGK